jgi:hypothetical protein
MADSDRDALAQMASFEDIQRLVDIPDNLTVSALGQDWPMAVQSRRVHMLGARRANRLRQVPDAPALTISGRPFRGRSESEIEISGSAQSTRLTSVTVDPVRDLVQVWWITLALVDQMKSVHRFEGYGEIKTMLVRAKAQWAAKETDDDLWEHQRKHFPHLRFDPASEKYSPPLQMLRPVPGTAEFVSSVPPATECH